MACDLPESPSRFVKKNQKKPTIAKIYKIYRAARGAKFYAGLSGKTGEKKWRRLRESNPCTSRERAVS